MAFRFSFDEQRCFNCGVCMDTCPFHALDMTRSASTGTLGAGVDPSWLMEFPLQVGTCTGCRICEVECPVQAIRIEKVEEEVRLARSPGPRDTEAPDDGQWRPLTAYTRVSRKTERSRDPWPRFALTWKSIPHARVRDRRFEFTA